MIYVGTDIQLIGKLEKLLDEKGARFTNYLFTEKEQKYCNSRKYPYMHYTGKFAAKEAVKKAMLSSKLYSDVLLKDIEILNDESGCPIPKITNISDYPMTIKLSISHSGEYAMSVAVMFNETHINTETIF